MAVAFFVSLLVPALHADSLDYLLANCGRACGSLPGSVTVTLTCQQRKWQIAAIESSSREAAVTDESLDSLSTLTTLDQLALGSSSWHHPDNYTGMTPKAFRLLSTLQLRRLSLSGNVTGNDLEGICLLGSLEDLGLVGCCRGQMMQNDVTSLCQLKNLRRLRLSGMALNDASLNRLEMLKTIEELSLSGMHIPPDRMDTLRNLQNLHSLSLESLDAKGVAVLEGLPHLEYLCVGGYDLSSGEADLSRLARVQCLEIGFSTSELAVRIRLPKNLNRISVWSTDVEQFDWGSAPQLEFVEVGSPSPDEGIGSLKWLHRLPNLKAVRLNGVLDKCVSQLAEFADLREIEIGGRCRPWERFGDVGMNALGGLRNIESFTIHTYGSYMTDSGFQVLQNFPKLRQLTLTSCFRVTEEGLATIPGLGQLRSLTLLYSGYKPDSSLDQVAHAIQAATQVEELHLGGQMLSDTGLRHLANLKNVRRLDVSETQGYSEKGLVRLIRELPNLEYLKFALPRSTSGDGAAP